MLSKYQKLLDGVLTDLCEKMDTVKVTSELLKDPYFDKTDLETVMHPPTTRDKNSTLVDVLQGKDFDILSEFLRSLSSIDKTHLALAEAIQPVRFRILWFSINPAHAAAVVHTLKEYARASFSRMQRIGKDSSLILRRSRVFKKEYSKEELVKDTQESERYSHEVEVCLVFPSSQNDPIASLETCFKEKLISQPDVLVMGGVCEVGGESGLSLVVSKATNAKGVCVKPTGYNLAFSDFSQIRDARSSCIDQKRDRLCDHLESLHVESYSMQALECSSSESSPAFDPDTFKFYSLCQDYFPESRSLVCKGSMPSLASDCARELEGVAPVGACGQMVESAAMVTSTCALMNIINYYYKHTMIE